MKLLGLIFALSLLPVLSHAEVCKTISAIDVAPYKADIGTRKVTFVALDLTTNECRVINPQELTQRHGPYSTFKIPHTLIALETGAVKSIDERFEWDQAKHPAKDFWPETWKQSHTLATAFKHSAVWYYRDLVPRIDPKQYKKWLAKFHYGNQTFTPGSDDFWLDGELKISPEEQVAFIKCLVKTRCGISAKHIAAFEVAALQGIKNSISLYAKTGTGPLDGNNFDGAFEGWYVGYLKDGKGKATTAFAIYMQAESFSALKDYRKELTLRLLADLGRW